MLTGNASDSFLRNIYICTMFSKYATIVRPIIYGSLALFNFVVYFIHVPALYLGGNKSNNLVFGLIFMVLLGIHFWMTKRLRKLSQGERK
jgi:hypothetical protein